MRKVYTTDGSGYRGCVMRIYGENGANGNTVTGLSYFKGELISDGSIRVADVATIDGLKVATLINSGITFSDKSISKLAEKVATYLDSFRGEGGCDCGACPECAGGDDE